MWLNIFIFLCFIRSTTVGSCISQLVNRCFPQLRPVRRMWAVPLDVAKAVANSFIISRELTIVQQSVGLGSIVCTESVLDTATRLVVVAMKRYHNSNIVLLDRFTGLRFRSASNSSCACWRSRRCMDSHRHTSPICHLCHPTASVGSRRRLRSAIRIATPTSSLTHAQAFAVAGPTVWNQLAADVPSTESVNSLKTAL